MTTPTPLQTDTYYRGYRLSTTWVGEVRIYKDADFLSDAKDRAQAEKIIDNWLNAR